MKKIEANRYPNSATLFKFCKEALEIRYEGNVKVIDQDVGAILGYDPADCSHWKKGKKNIRSLNTLRSIADHLNIDERLLIDITSGRIGLDEAVYEYRGYGQFSLTGKSLENYKKEFFKNPSKWQHDGQNRTFEELFDIDRNAISKVAIQIAAMGQFNEAPIYIPEVFRLFENINAVANDALTEPIAVKREGEGKALVTTIEYRGSEMRPFMRFIAAKALFVHLARSGHPVVGRFSHSPEEVLEVQSNIFAGMLLIPGNLLRGEVERIDSSLDIVMQLADVFWVSKALMNQRLRDYMEHLS